MIKFYTVLSVLMTFLCSGQPRNVYFYSEINNKPKNCSKKDSDVRLICKTKGTASRMIIKRARDDKTLYTSPKARTSAEFLIENVQCVDVGVYQCLIDNQPMQTTALVLPECPPLPCHQEGTTMSVEAEVNKPLDISLCVLVYPGILNYTRVNNGSLRRKASLNNPWSWESNEPQEIAACFKNVTISLKHRNWTAEDYGTMSVRVYSSAGEVFYLDYNISVIPPGSSLEGKEGTEDNDANGDTDAHGDNKVQEDNEAREDMITFLPPFLVIAGAVVLTVVMIVRKEKMKKQKQQTL